MTTFYLVRHGNNDFLPRRLAGRLPDVHLNDAGREEARRVAERLRPFPITRIFSSPMERCRETATPLAEALGLTLQVSDPLNEVDFGEWKGADVQAIGDDVRWKRWNEFRTGHVIPGGETMVAIQARVAGEMIRLKNLHPNEHLALFSHGDPIRAALCYWLGIPLDFLPRLHVDTGAISIVSIHNGTAIVSGINIK